MEDMTEMQQNVTKLLMTKYDLTINDAEEVIEESLIEDKGMWHVNAEAEDIAKYLASPENE
jgi:hypothetical protein